MSQLREVNVAQVKPPGIAVARIVFSARCLRLVVSAVEAGNQTVRMCHCGGIYVVVDERVTHKKRQIHRLVL